MAKRLRSNSNPSKLDDESGEEDSLREPEPLPVPDEEEVDVEVLPKGKDLVGRDVMVLFDKKWWDGKVQAYTTKGDVYTVKFHEDGAVEKDVKWKEMIPNPDGWSTLFPDDLFSRQLP